MIRYLVTLVVLLLVAVSCGGVGEPEEVAEARAQVDEAFTGGSALQLLAVSLLIDHPELELSRQKVREALASPSLQVKLHALDIVERWGMEGFETEIGTLLDDSNEIVRRGAAELLAEAGDERAGPILEGAVRDQDGLLLPGRCAALASIGKAACVDEAEKDLAAKSEAIVAAAAGTLAAVGGDRARDALRGALKRQRGERRAPVIEALGEVGDASDVGRLRGYLRYRENLLAVVRAFGSLGGDDAVATLREYMAKEDPVVSVESAGALLRAGVFDAPVLDTLAAAASAERDEVRYLAARDLARAPEGAPVSEVLLRFAEDGDPRVRREALGALAERAGSAPDGLLAACESAYAAGQNEMEGALYESAQRALVAAGRLDSAEARTFLGGVVRESDNWAHILQAAFGLLDAHERAARAPA